MKAFLHFLCLLFALCCSGFAAADAPADQAKRQVQQPLNNAPVWREVRSGEPNYTATRGVDTGVLIQSGGQTWRELRNGPISLYGGIIFVAALLGVGLFYRMRGPIKLAQPKTGRLIQRFTLVERSVHWTMAGSFVVLMISGLVMLFGKHVLLPVFGYTLFSWLALLCKNVHNFIGPVFLASALFFIVLVVKDNMWQAIDAHWIRKAGGLVSGAHVPSWRFNFGEKTWFWLGVVGLGLVVSASGLVLNFPNFEQGRGVMQTANIIHVVGALIIMTLALGHIYIGTVGMEGAIDGMRCGYVDETWAKEHHELWYEQKKHEVVSAEELEASRAAPGPTVRT